MNKDNIGSGENKTEQKQNATTNTSAENIQQATGGATNTINTSTDLIYITEQDIKKDKEEKLKKAKAEKERVRQEEKQQKKEKRTQNAKQRLQKLALNMQRGSNEAAVVQARSYNGFFIGIIINALGQLLYEIGFQAEYIVVKSYRRIKYVLYAFAAGFLAIMRSILRPLGMMFLGIWKDLTQPFIQLGKGTVKLLQEFKNASKKGNNPFVAMMAFFKEGIKQNKRNIFYALGYLLPVGAVFIFMFTVNSALSTPFSLAVTYNGELMGYVESDTVWDDAEQTVESRVRAAHDEQSFETNPEFQVVSVSEAARVNSAQLADRIIESSSDQIAEASGIYVGENLVGVASDGDAIRNLLDETLARVTPQGDPAARVSFTNDIYVEDGLYFTESISNFTQIESTLNTNSYLQTAVTVTETRDVEVPFPELEEDSAEYAQGVTRIQQYGKDGLTSLTEDVTYIDGVEVSRVLLNEVIITEPTPQIKLLGTADPSELSTYTGAVAAGSGALAWPVPEYTGTTSEFGYHRGLDITAPLGTAIYACDSGTVVEAGWHWSWGNYILINHGNGMTTRYAHCSQLSVVAGTDVAKGTLIGLVGNTGVSYGNHLHLEVEVNGSLTNPRNYVSQP